MTITKDYLEKLIQEKAERKVDQMLRDALDGLVGSDLDGNGNPCIKFNDKCGELSGKYLYSTFGDGDDSLLNIDGYRRGEHGLCDTAMLEKYTNWKEIRSELIEKYKKDETDVILKNLSGIGDFLNRYGK